MSKIKPLGRDTVMVCGTDPLVDKVNEIIAHLNKAETNDSRELPKNSISPSIGLTKITKKELVEIIENSPSMIFLKGWLCGKPLSLKGMSDEIAQAILERIK